MKNTAEPFIVIAKEYQLQTAPFSCLYEFINPQLSQWSSLTFLDLQYQIYRSWSCLVSEDISIEVGKCLPK